MSEDFRLANVVAFVESTTFEENCIWSDLVEKYKKVKSSDWSRQNSGFLKTIGEIQNRPINIVCSFVTIKDKLVCFYNAVSQLVDYEMVENWIRQQSTQENVVYTNAQNFHIALNRIQQE